MTEEKERKNTTVLGEETEFEGELAFSDNLVITGSFRGTIQATGDLEIDRTGSCEVSRISANSIVVSGNVVGNLYAPERIELCTGSAVCGELETGRLRIADNVTFDGQVTMIETVPDVDLFSVASSEYKQALVVKSGTAQG